MVKNILINMFPKPEPYHEIVIQLFNNNKHIVNDLIDNGIEDKNINMGVWMNAVSNLIISVETYKNVSGKLKKRIILEFALIVIDQTKLNSENKFYIKSLINITLPQVIDLMVNLSKKINLEKSKFGRCIKKGLMCFCYSPQILPEPSNDIELGEVIEEIEE